MCYAIDEVFVKYNVERLNLREIIEEYYNSPFNIIGNKLKKYSPEQ